MKKLFILASVLFVGLTLTACGSNNSQDKTNASLKAENSSLRKAENESIVGSYKDDQDGAAITLNSDHTGRYVYADYVDSDTDDQLTWKKDSNGTYTITLQDSNVTGSLTGKLEGTKLILSGDSNWNTEEFIKVKGNLDLDKFLADKHRSSSNESSSESTLSTTDVANKFAQLKDIDQNEVNIYVHPTDSPDVFRVYCKAKDSDPEVDSIVDHYFFNVKTNQITQGTR